MRVTSEALRTRGSNDVFFLFLVAAKAVALGIHCDVPEEDYATGFALWVRHGRIGLWESGAPLTYRDWQRAGCPGLKHWQHWYCLGFPRVCTTIIRTRMLRGSPCAGFPSEFDFKLGWEAEPVRSAPSAREHACLSYLVRERLAVHVGCAREVNVDATRAWSEAGRPGFGSFEVWAIEKELSSANPTFDLWKRDGRPGFREWRDLLSPGFQEVAAPDIATSYRLSLHHIALKTSNLESTPGS